MSKQEPIIIGGCDRSGTTLLRALLDTHRNIAIGPESWIFAWRPRSEFLSAEYSITEVQVKDMLVRSHSLVEFAEKFFGHYCHRLGKQRWGEKSPANILRLDYIFEKFPGAKVIHIVRDPRDVVCSLRHHPKRMRKGSGYVANYVDRPISECVRWWLRYVGAGLRHRSDARYLEVRYEDLVANTEYELRRILSHLNEPWDPSLLEHAKIQSSHPIIGSEIVNSEVREPVNNHAVRRWEKDLSQQELTLVEKNTASMRRALGYD